MSFCRITALIAMLMLCRATQVHALMEKYLVVKVQDWTGKVSYQVMTSDEYKELYKDVRLELRLRTRAMSAAQKAWREMEDVDTKTFPRSAIETPSVRSMQTFNERGKAEAKASSYEARLRDAGKKKEENRKKWAGIGHQGHGKVSYLKTDKEREKKRAAREEEREARNQRALQLFLNKLELLKQAAGRPPASSGP